MIDSFVKSFSSKSLNTANYDDSDRPNSVVQMDGSHASYSAIFIENCNVKIMYAIYSHVNTSMHCGRFFSLNSFYFKWDESGRKSGF